MRLRPLPCFHVRHNISGAAVEPDPVAIFAGNDPETVMFDFMRHGLARGRGLGLGLDDEPPRGVRGRLGAGNVTVSAVPLDDFGSVAGLRRKHRSEVLNRRV